MATRGEENQISISISEGSPWKNPNGLNWY